MKKLFAIAIVGLALVSCKKNSPAGIGNNGIQATVGGSGSTYNILASGTLSVFHFGSDSGQTINLSATNSTSASNADYIALSIKSDTVIATGVYSDTAIYNAASKRGTYKLAGFSYSPYANPFDMPSDYFSAAKVSSPFTITVTAVSSTSISGTFQGPSYLDADTTKLSKAVTSGQFTVMLTKQ
jgi:hypothetical protein